jgi:putative tricarboxylic transport membrane protein
MRKFEFYASIFLVVFSLTACREAYRLSLGRFGAPGPGLYPFLVSALLLLLSLLYVIKSSRMWRTEKEIDLWTEARWGKVTLVLCLLVAYGVLIEKAGFMICTFLFLMSLFLLVDRQRWYWVYPGSFGITLACYAIFKMWLKIQLPVGFLRIGA